MKIAYGSDIHLEFGWYEINNHSNADLLVLAGDIGIVSQDHHKEKLIDFLEICGKLYKDTIYILGNHEHYMGDFDQTFNIIKETSNHIPNVYVLENEIIEINDFQFLCGTMWTDCNKEDPITKYQISSLLNDYMIISHKERNLSPSDTIECFDKFNKFLKENLYRKSLIVISHHAPSFKSIPDQYKSDYVLNGGFASSLDELIMDHPNIKLWIHGHIHTPCEYYIGETLVTCNPRGYIGRESIALDFQLKTIEV